MLYGNVQFAISSARRLLSVVRSVPVLKFEENIMKNKSKHCSSAEVEAERKMRELLNTVS